MTIQPLLISKYVFEMNISPKNENLQRIYSPSEHPRYRWDVSSWEQILEKCSIPSLAHQWILCMFLSVVWTLILTAPIHCRGSIGEQVCQICSHEETNSTTSWIRLRVSKFSAKFKFWVNYSFNVIKKCSGFSKCSISVTCFSVCKNTKMLMFCIEYGKFL